MKSKTKKSKTKKSKTKAVYGWAWVFDGGLCKWASPTRKQLKAGGKPSPEAKPVHVAIVQSGDYRRLKANAQVS